LLLFGIKNTQNSGKLTFKIFHVPDFKTKIDEIYDKQCKNKANIRHLAVY